MAAGSIHAELATGMLFFGSDSSDVVDIHRDRTFQNKR